MVEPNSVNDLMLYDKKEVHPLQGLDIRLDNDSDLSIYGGSVKHNGAPFLNTGDAADLTTAAAGVSTTDYITPASLVVVKGTVGSLYYVHPTVGLDTNDGRYAGAPFRTVGAAITTVPVGSHIKLLPGTHVVTNHVSKNDLSFEGCGTGETKIRWSSTTGEVFDLSNCSDNTWRNMALIPNGVQKTAGALFKLLNGRRNRFENLFIQSPFQGFNIGGGDVTLRDIAFGDYNATWPWDYAIGIIGAAATAVTLDKITGISVGQAGAPNGFIYIAAGSSTINLRDIIYSSPGTGLGGIKGLNIVSGQWVYATQCEFESGTAVDACTILGGNAIHLTDCHFIGLRGCVISGAPTFVSITGGEAIKCQQYGIDVQGGSKISIDGVNFMDVSQQTTNTYDAVRVAAGVSKLKIVNNMIDVGVNGNGNVARYGVNVLAGASDYYIISNNVAPGVGTGAVFDGGTGLNKAVANNV